VNRHAPADAGATIVARGARGEPVAALKAQLRAWFETAWPGEWERFRIADNDVFGAQLERAVKVFQARAGLAPDGRVGPLTRAALAAEPTGGGTAAATPKDLAYPGPLKRRSSGDEVRLVQGWLSLHRHHVAIDGAFGPATETALRAFQARRGVAATGVLDEATWSLLVAPMVAALTPLRRRAPLGELVVAYAKQHLKQHPREVGGQNRGPWVRLYTDGREGEAFPWCAGFATTVLAQACATLGVPMPIERTLACDRMADTAGTRFVRGSTAGARARLRPGSFFLQQATGAERQRYRYRHTGIVVAASAETMATIEGNTNDDGSAEGYEVCARTRGYANMDFVVL